MAETDRVVRASDVVKLLAVALGKSDEDAARAVAHLPDATPPAPAAGGGDDDGDERPDSIAAQVAAGQEGAVEPFKCVWDGEGSEPSALAKARGKIGEAARGAGDRGLLA